VIRYFLSTISSLHTVLHEKSLNDNREFSAIAKKVVIKQLLIAAA